MNGQRIAIGLTGLGLLGIGLWCTLVGSSGHTGLGGILVRVGALLSVIWLAMPQLESVRTKISTIVFLVLLVILVIAAARPNLFKVLAVIASLTLALGGAMKWLQRMTTDGGK